MFIKVRVRLRSRSICKVFTVTLEPADHSMKITITTLQLQCGSLFVIVIFLPITVNFNSVFSLPVWLEHPEIFRPLLF